MAGTTPSTYLDAINFGTSTGGAAGTAETTSTLYTARTDTQIPPDSDHISNLAFTRMQQLMFALTSFLKGGTRLQTLNQTANPFSVGELGYWGDTSDNPRFTTSAGAASYLGTSTGLIPGVGAVLSSATTIAPTNTIHLVSGTTAIVNITAPSGFSGPLYLIPSGLWAMTNAGNIALAVTAVVSKVVVLVYNPSTSKWYPSYT